MASESFWASRMRWRLRGAWMWPAYAVLTPVDALIMHQLPPIRTGVDFVPALLIASFTNLFIIGALAPWLVWLIARHSREETGTPREIRLDRIATAMLCAAFVGIVAAGLAARPATIVETEAREINAEEVRDYVRAHGPPDVKRNLELGAVNTIRFQEDGYFRNCVPYADRERWFCFFVDAKKDPPSVRRDPSTLNNNDFLRGRELP